MQPTNPLQPRGSFTKPQTLTKAINQAEASKSVQPMTQQESPETPKTETSPELEQASSEDQIAKEDRERAENLAQIKKDIEKDLEASITDEDLKTYLFKGVLSKEIAIVKGMLKGVFRTSRINELQELDIKMAKIRDEAKHTPQGLANEEAIYALSYAWTHADGKPLGVTPEDREKKIRDMGSLFIERASTARVRFETLLKIAMNERGVLKK